MNIASWLERTAKALPNHPALLSGDALIHDYYVLETLPKNNYGKVLKTELRSMLEAKG